MQLFFKTSKVLRLSICIILALCLQLTQQPFYVNRFCF